MTKRFLIFCALIFAAGTAMADHTYDSLYAVAVKTPLSDTVDKWDPVIMYIWGKNDSTLSNGLRDHFFTKAEEYRRLGDTRLYAHYTFEVVSLNQVGSRSSDTGNISCAKNLIPLLIKYDLLMDLEGDYLALGTAYLDHNDNISLNYYLLALSVDKASASSKEFALYTIGGIYKRAGNYTKAIDYLKQALEYEPAHSARIRDISFYYSILGMCDSAYRYLNVKLSAPDNSFDSSSYFRATAYYYKCSGQADSALPYFKLCLDLYTRVSDTPSRMHYLIYTCNDLYHIYAQKNQRPQMDSLVKEVALLCAMQPTDIIGLQGLLIGYKLLEEDALSKKNFQEAYQYRLQYTFWKDSTDALASLSKYEAVQDKNQMDQRIAKVNEESRLKDELAARRSQQQQVAGGVAVFILLLVASFGFIQYRNRKIIQKEKDRSEGLLLNILPTEVAEELKVKGSAKAQHFNDVTVLFTDFKSFTTVSERLTPQQLVDELHACFSAFDGIMQKYGIEKIKTVGDAYLAVSGLPIGHREHAAIMVRAAIEIRDFMLARKKELGDMTFEIRIGVHSGSVVAGIVGVKKFAYDIWGDTVNTAARMEQNSEAGKINISESTYALIKNNFSCTPRGEIEAKNKGKLKMYFVNEEVA